MIIETAILTDTVENTEEEIVVMTPETEEELRALLGMTDDTDPTLTPEYEDDVLEAQLPVDWTDEPQ